MFVQIHPVEGTSFQQSFEGLVDAIGSLPGMVFEMDGSFVWVDHTIIPPKQMDGMVYDKDNRLAYLEIKGDVSEMQWRTLCNAVCLLPFEQNEEEAWNQQLRAYDVGTGMWMANLQ
jgi:hypothetical protein